MNPEAFKEWEILDKKIKIYTSPFFWLEGFFVALYSFMVLGAFLGFLLSFVIFSGVTVHYMLTVLDLSIRTAKILGSFLNGTFYLMLGSGILYFFNSLLLDFKQEREEKEETANSKEPTSGE